MYACNNKGEFFLIGERERSVYRTGRALQFIGRHIVPTESF